MDYISALSSIFLGSASKPTQVEAPQSSHQKGRREKKTPCAALKKQPMKLKPASDNSKKLVFSPKSANASKKSMRRLPLENHTSGWDEDEAISLHGIHLIKDFGHLGKFEGTVRYLGSRSRPYAFSVEYEDGDRETMTLPEVKALIQAQGIIKGGETNTEKKQKKD